jgi:hypothetical protein
MALKVGRGEATVGSIVKTPSSFVVNFNLPNKERIQKSFAFSKFGGEASALAAAEKFYNKVLKDPRVKKLKAFGTINMRNDVVKTFLNYLDKNGEFDGNEKLEKVLVKYRKDNIDHRYENINRTFKAWRAGNFDVDGIDNAKARKNIEVKNWSPKARGARTQNRENQLKFLDELNNQPELSLKAVKNKFNKKFQNKDPNFNKTTFIQRIEQLTQLKRNGSVPSNADGSKTRSYGISIGARSPWLTKALTESLNFSTNYNRLIRAADVLQKEGKTQRANRLYAAADDFFGSKGIFTKLPGNAEHPLSITYGKPEDILKVDSLVRGDLNRFKNDAFDNPIKRLSGEYNKKGTTLARRKEIESLMNNRKSFLNYLTSGSIDKGIVEKVNFNFTPQKVTLTANVTPVDELGRKFDFDQFVKKGEGFLDEFTKRGAGGNLLTAEGFAKRVGVSDTRIANLLKAVEKAPASCQKILSFQTGGISTTCAEAVVKDPVRAATKLQELDATQGPLAKVKNAATSFLKSGGFKTFGVAGLAGGAAAALVKEFRNDDPTTYLSNEDQQKNMLVDMVTQPISEDMTRPDILDFQLPAVGASLAASTALGAPSTIKASRSRGLGVEQKGLIRTGGRVLGRGLGIAASPGVLAPLAALDITRQVSEGDSLADIATDPVNYTYPLFAEQTDKLTRGLSPTLRKAARLGMSKPALRLLSRAGIAGLGASLAIQGIGLLDD